jgi:hypothetical protein
MINSEFFSGVVRNLAIGDNGNVLPYLKNLHNFGALAGQLSPAGFGLGILFDGTIAPIVECKIHFVEMLAGHFLNGKSLTCNHDSARAI